MIWELGRPCLCPLSAHPAHVFVVLRPTREYHGCRTRPWEASLVLVGESGDKHTPQVMTVPWRKIKLRMGWRRLGGTEGLLFSRKAPSPPPVMSWRLSRGI